MNRKITKLLILPAMLLCICVLFSAAAKKSSDADLIREMVIAYGQSRSKALPRVEELLSQLEERDPDTADMWRSIMDYWRYANNEMELNDRLPDDLDDSDGLCIAVLGFELNADGSIRPELRRRLQIALKCANQYPNAYILCTGGGTALGDPDATEAGRMAAWLRDQGVAPGRIIVEDRSLSTGQNAINSYEILRCEYPEISSIAIVSSDYHIPWGALMFQTRCILGGSEVEVVSNAVYRTTYREKSLHMLQAMGILEVAGFF